MLFPLKESYPFGPKSTLERRRQKGPIQKPALKLPSAEEEAIIDFRCIPERDSVWKEFHQVYGQGKKEQL